MSWANGVFLAAATSLLAMSLCGCGGNHAPVLQPISDQLAAPGVELSIELRATDADGDSLHFDYDAPGIADIKSRAQLSTFADNVAIFRWTPMAADVSDTPYPFDFKVSDGHTTATETVQVTVAAAAGQAPVFRQPLGTGTTLDLSKDKCIDVPIVVEDNDSTMVTLADDDPQIDGSTLTQNDAFSGTWHWCPSAAQIAAQDRYLLHLSADDGTNTTLKTYLIVLRVAAGNNCPGMPPTIMHSPAPATSTVLDLTIDADISDDLGVKSALVYWSTTTPGNPPDVTKMTPVAMTRISGDALSGTYEATIPNPVTADPAGTTKTVYYLIEAKDNDDPTGSCDHLVDAPSSGTYSVDVTNPGSMRGTLGACDPCTSDVQCQDGYECLQIGTSGTFCARECAAAGSCDTSYSCSSSALTSIDGKLSRYCRPTSMTCPPMLVCVEDSLEDNDTRTNIPDTTSADLPLTGTPATFTKTSLVMCPRNGGASADEDWYGVSATENSILQAGITIKDYSVGSHADLDMELTDDTGSSLDFSVGTGDTEYVAACVAPGSKSFVHVFTFDSTVVASKYDMTVTRIGPDANEGKDDDANTSVRLGPSGSSVSQNICGSDDWFWTDLVDGDHLVVDLKYTARSSNEGLAVNVMQDDCLGATPVNVATGDPVDGGARVTFDTPDGGTGNCYYVAVSAQNAGGGNTYQLDSIEAP